MVVELRAFHTNKMGQTYYVSSDGRLLRELGQTGTNGYRKVYSRITGYTGPVLIHQIVAQAFLGPCPPGKQVNHKNGKKDDNRIENLEYLTPSENTLDTFKRGRVILFGEKHGSAILTEAQVTEIRKILGTKKGKRFGPTLKDIGKRFGVTRQTIGLIWNKDRWGRVA